MSHTQNDQYFLDALREVMHLGGFTIYHVYSHDKDAPDAVIESITLARSPEALEAGAIAALSAKQKAVN